MANVQLAVAGDDTTQVILSVPGVQGPAGSNLPPSGATHQLLYKQSSTDYDTGWKLITNDNVDASAAIAGTKISPNFGSQNAVTTGTNTAASFIPTSSSVPANGLYLPSSNNVAISTNGTGKLFIDSSGRVGVGTTNVDELLHVESDGATPKIKVESTLANSSPGFRVTNDARTYDIRIDGTNDNLQFYDATASQGRVAIDSSGRLLVGTPTSYSPWNSLIQSAGTENQFAALGFSTTAGIGPRLAFTRSKSGTIGTNTIVVNGDSLGDIVFAGANTGSYSTAAIIKAFVDGTPNASPARCPGALTFSTTADGASSPTPRMTIASGGRVSAPSWYDETTAGAANVNVGSTGILQRSTSSIKYKTDVETIEDAYSDALLSCRPVWYRSTCKNDNPDWGHWGFIAEEVAEIDPRLCFFKKEEDGTLEPEGVQYDRFVPHLLNLIKRQQQAIETLEAKVAALESA